ADWFLYKVVPKRNAYGWYYGDEDEGPAPELMESGQLELDEDGEAQSQRFKATEEGIWRFVVKVTDGSGQQNSGTSQVRAAAGDLVLLVGTDRNVAAPGKPFQATARALDLEGKELTGQAITLKATRIIADKQDSYWWSRPTALKPGEVITTANGPKANLTIPEGGLFLVVAETHDSKGRLVVAQRLLTVAAEGTPLPSVPDLRANADKAEYRVGDTARILVRLPKARLTLHWALENEALGKRETRAVQGTTAVIDIPITAAMQPNVWAVFEIVADGRRQLAEVPIRVPKVDRRLQVDVQLDKERYQPGQPMKVAVLVKDVDGKPVAADLSVGVVDEAIYALSAELHPDPVRFFHPTRRHGVIRTGSTEWSFWDILRRQRPVWSLKQTKRGEFKNDDADKVRQNFKDTAHWVPFLAAGSDGKASTELVLPDNLTAWRATATAVTGDTKIGVGRTQRPSSKPLQVSLTLPRTLSVGEEARAIAQVRNLSGQGITGKVKIEVSNGRLGGATEATFTIQDQGEYRLALPLFADKVGALTITARVEGGGLKDAERRTVSVQEQMIPASVSGYVALNGTSESITIPVPAGAKGDAAFSVTPVGGLEHLVAPSLRYLVEYPYGCVEQTLSSFVPNVLVADLVKRGLMPPLDWKDLTNLDRNIRDGVFRVYGYQQPNGGWGWYAPNDFGLEANPHTTGYAIWSLAAMKRLGYDVDENVYRRGRHQALNLFRELARRADQGKQQPRSAQGEDLDPAASAAFLLMSLAPTGEPIAGMVESSADKALKGVWPGSHVLAMLAVAAAETKHPKAMELANRLEQVTLQKGGLSHWEGTKENWHGYASGDVVPTINALKALCLTKPQSPVIVASEAFLATQHQGYGWYSTWSTSQAVSLLPYLA
ncbi:MAG: alpha-2-macroglobulin family protein, partial [Holophaga sp.]